jgi:hypothetical protein
MSATGLDVFDKTIQTANIWLDEIMAEVGPTASSPGTRCLWCCERCAVESALRLTLARNFLSLCGAATTTNGRQRLIPRGWTMRAPFSNRCRNGCGM